MYTDMFRTRDHIEDSTILPSKYHTGDMVFLKITDLDVQQLKFKYELFKNSLSPDLIATYIIKSYDGNKIVFAKYLDGRYCAIRTEYIGYIKNHSIVRYKDGSITYSISWEMRNEEEALPGIPKIISELHNDEYLVGISEIEILSAKELFADIFSVNN